MFGTTNDQDGGSAFTAPPMPTSAPAPVVQDYVNPSQTAAPTEPQQPSIDEVQAHHSASIDPTMSNMPIDSPDPVTDAAPTAEPSSPLIGSAPVLDTSEHDELFAIKQEALQHLGPMVGDLEQTPEEKFKTLMMMIQASDDHTKLREAFEIAKTITDDKARAQALLDIINEINYFTQPPA